MPDSGERRKRRQRARLSYRPIVPVTSSESLGVGRRDATDARCSGSQRSIDAISVAKLWGWLATVRHGANKRVMDVGAGGGQSSGFLTADTAAITARAIEATNPPARATLRNKDLIGVGMRWLAHLECNDNAAGVFWFAIGHTTSAN